MSKKKSEIVEQNPEQQTEHQKPVEQPKDPEPIYLVETLIKLEEIEQYGLNQYFIHAILPDKFYTLSEAKSRIESFLNDPNK